MRLATGIDSELSLEAMWHAYRASNFGDQQRVEIDASVAHALLRTRYDDGSKGAFLSVGQSNGASAD
jgi:hypothetical protein